MEDPLDRSGVDWQWLSMENVATYQSTSVCITGRDITDNNT